MELLAKVAGADLAKCAMCMHLPKRFMVRMCLISEHARILVRERRTIVQVGAMESIANSRSILMELIANSREAQYIYIYI